MKLKSFLSRRLGAALVFLCLAAALCTPRPADAAATDLAASPLETSVATLVKPNILYVLDDSGSMDYNYLPDWANDYGNLLGSLFYNSRFNGQYYDPAVTYTPPLKYDGSSYPAMTSGNTSAFLRVPVDGYGVQSTGTASLINVSGYYSFIAGEYCNAPNLRTCVTQNAATAAYPFPAYVRWCTNLLLTNCQASRIETAPAGGSTYTNPRVAGGPLGLGLVPGSIVLTYISALQNSYVYPGTSAKASSRTDCAGNTCTYAEEMTNFANWYAYYQTRMQATKTAISLAFNTLGTNYRLGYMTINNNTNRDFLNVLDNTTTAGGQKQAWYAKLVAAIPSDSTPLKKALATAGRYYAGKLATVNNLSATDPIQYACQRNYTMLSTDGYWNETTAPVQVGGAAIGNQDGSEVRPYLDGNNAANTLADVAQYYYATDLRSSAFSNTLNASGVDVSSNAYSNKQQRMNTYSIGLGASGYMQFQSNYASATSGDYFNVANGTATNGSTLAAGNCIWQSSGACNWPTPVNNSQTTIDDLWHAAVNGRGTYYSATNATELKNGLTSFLNSVDAISSSSASATLSTQNLNAGSTNYLFSTRFCSAKWYGDLMRFTVDPVTGAVGSTPSWSQSGSGGDCDGSAGLTTTPLLDNAPYAARTIYTYDPAVSTALLPFQWASLSATAKSYFQINAITPLSQICPSGTACLPAAAQVNSSTAGTTTGAGGINLVNYLRGDRSNEGPTSASYYFARTHVLGDIVNSQSVFVQTPPSNYSDAGYSSFKAAQSSRQAMVYVGANDGMLHAFNADNGAETWAYIPSTLLPSLYKLADKNYASNHQFFMDGPTVQADIYTGGAWRTILVGGLGGGGRSYYALDVTVPASPTLLWEFTNDTTKGAPYIVDQDLGYSYGRPVVTKLADGTWVVLVTSGYNNVSPGSGHGVLWVLNARTGAVIRKLDTGVGTTVGGGVVAGCSVAPCPAGLSKISVWVDNAQNNLATQVYGGDLFGNVWRFDISALTGTGTGAASVQLMASLADAAGTRQPVTSRPELGYTNGAHIVYVGTGAYLGVSDIGTTQTQTMYAIKDPLTTSGASLYGNPRGNSCSTNATSSACFVRQILADNGGTRTATSSVSYPWTLATMNGWYIDMPFAGERMDTDPTLQLGTLVFVSNLPSTTGACSVGGSSYLNYLNFRTGTTVSGATNAGITLSTTGISSTPTIAKTTSGSIVAETTSSSVQSADGGGQSGSTPTGGSNVYTNLVPSQGTATGTRRISWRRLTDSQ